MANITVEDSTNFVLTQERIDFVFDCALGASCFALALSLFVCLASIWIYSVPKARHHLDRVSFRILLWSMVAEIVYNICYINLNSNDPLKYHRTACGGTVYLLLGTMGLCNWLCTCIGFNLMLAITFNINPIQARLERWYILGSFVLGLGVPLVPAILGHFGYDAYYDGCYFTEQDDMRRLTDFISDLYLWQLLSCLVAAGSVVTVLITLIRRSRATERALFRRNSLNISSSELRQITSGTTITSTSSESSLFRRLCIRIGYIPRSARGRSHMHRLEDKLAGIALKISLYPLVLLFINVYITSEDLSTAVRGGVSSRGEYASYWLHNVLYGGRGIFFALLGIFVDPCLRLGLPAAFRGTFRKSAEDRERGEMVEVKSQMEWTESQSISDFLMTSEGPGKGAILSATEGWRGVFGLEKRGGGKKGDVEMGDTIPLGLDNDTGRRSLNVESKEVTSSTFTHHRDLPIDIDPHITQSIPTSNPGITTSSPPLSPIPLAHLSRNHRPATSPSISTSQQPTTPRRPSLRLAPPILLPANQPSWIEPLASAILSPTSAGGGGHTRRNSDPAMGVVQFRRRELQLAAEEMYKATQMRL